MGFLRFLKKKEGLKIAEDDLDIPPAPPSIGEDFGLESLGEELPRPPELPELPDVEEEVREEDEEKKPEIPSFRPERFVPLEKGPSREEKKILEEIHEHKVTKPIFVKISRYKYVLDEIEVIKSYLNNLESASIRFDELREERDNKFEKWNEHFKDLQKKLIFVDNVLFKNR